MSSENITRRLNIYINGAEVTNSLSGIGRAIGQTRRELRNLDASQDNYQENLARLQQRLGELNTSYGQLSEEINGTTEEMNAAGEAFSNLFTGLRSGNLTQAAAGLGAIKAAIIATTQAALKFIATPIGATIAILAGIAGATKEWYNYNKEVAKANSLTAGITKLAGDELNDARRRSKALADTFDQDQQEILEAARAMVNEFDITYGEAFDSIEKGFVKGGYASDEFLSSLKEYPTFFAQAGFAVEDFQSLVNTGIDLGIYDDKLPDAIKEFALSINEQTDTVKDALYNAFGPEFTDKLLSGVKNGTITVKDALTQVSEEAGRLGLNVQQAQQLTADLFRGAGEDAGGAIKIFEAVTTSIKNQNASLSEADKAVKDLTDSELELAKAKDAFLQSDGFAMWSNKFNEWVNGVKAGFYQVLSTITNSKEELEKMNQGSTTKDAIKMGMRETEAKFLKAMAKKELDDFKAHVSEQKKELGGLYQFETDKEEYIAGLKAQKAKAETDLERKKFQANIDAITNYQEKAAGLNNKFSLEEINAQKKANDEKRKLYEKQQEQEKKDRKKAAEEMAKAAIEEYKNLAKANLEYYLASHTSKLDAEKQLTQEIIAEEKKRLDDIARERLKAIGIEKQTNDDIIAAKRATGQFLTAADTEYLTEKLKLETENHKAIAELNKQYDEEQKALAAEQLLADKELALAEAESAEEEERIKSQQKYDEELERYRQMLADKKITDDEYVRFKDALDKKQKEMERAREIAEYQKSLGALGNLASAVGEMFGQSKELALAQAAINGGLAITSILAQYPKFDGGIAMYAAIAAATFSTAAQIKKITTTKKPKVPKFFKGGDTGNKANMGYDEYGAVTGVVHDNEYVVPKAMTQDPQYANILGWLENRRQLLPGYYDGGPVSAPGTSAAPTVAVPETTNNNGELAVAINRLNSNLESGIVARAIFGYEQLEELNTMNDEIKASNQNGKLNT